MSAEHASAGTRVLSASTRVPEQLIQHFTHVSNLFLLLGYSRISRGYCQAAVTQNQLRCCGFAETSCDSRPGGPSVETMRRDDDRKCLHMFKHIFKHVETNPGKWGSEPHVTWWGVPGNQSDQTSSVHSDPKMRNSFQKSRTKSQEVRSRE